MFQQLFHNASVQHELMNSAPDKEDPQQIVLYQVRKLFWRLRYTKMSQTYLDEFCRVFTSFDGLPINVRV
jgi:hypothetical protein